VSEYKEIADSLASSGVLSKSSMDLMKMLAGYRNRLVHFYHEVSADELFEICSTELADVVLVQKALRHWVDAHPELIDEQL
jgi:uncharacterized protein YutE (UPF0331/DUF86 family)